MTTLNVRRVESGAAGLSRAGVLMLALWAGSTIGLSAGSAWAWQAGAGGGDTPGKTPGNAGGERGAAAAPDRDADAEHERLLRAGLRGVIAGARDRVFPALVNISVITVEYYGGKENKGASGGSGTIISADGHILTNAHVTASGRRFRVTLADKQEVPATLVGEDYATDLAVLKINPAELAPGTVLGIASLGDSDAVQVGDYVLAMGSPFALSRSVTLGIVSNTERVFTGFGADEIEADSIAGRSTGVFTRWIQHDALINPGNSGGPLVNMDGLVVGVNTRGGAGMGFASPANLARDIADKLIRFGEVPRSEAGWTLRQIDKTGEREGVLVTSVVQSPPGPAARAGLQPGDVLLSLNGAPVTARFPEQIPPILRTIADTPIGGSIPLTFRRGGEVREATLVTERMLREKGDETALRGWGVSVEEITESLARDLRLDSRAGVLVTGVRGGSPAALAEPSIDGGDVILAVGGKRVNTLAEFVELYRAVMDQPTIPEHLLIEFDRRGKNQVTIIKPRPEKPQDPPREVPKAWLGVATQPVLRELARQLGHEQTLGFRVTRIYPRTLAAQSGLKTGDIITALNGEKLSPRGMQDAGLLQRRIRALKIDEPAKLTVLRPGATDADASAGAAGAAETVEVEVTLERTRPGADEARRDTNKDFELTVRELTFFDRDDNRWDESVSGVIVEDAGDAGWASLAGLGSGDLIQRIDQTTVSDLTTYRAAMERIARDKPERVAFVVLRGNRTFFRFAEPEWKPLIAEAPGDGNAAATPATPGAGAGAAPGQP